MQYRLVEKWGPDNRTIILPGKFSPYKMQPNPKPNDIRLVIADCPIRKRCIVINYNNMTSICKDVDGYGSESEEDGRAVLGSMLCRFENISTHRPVILFRIAGCPEEEIEGCIYTKNSTRCVCEGFGKLSDFTTPLDLTRPHFSVTCQES